MNLKNKMLKGGFFLSEFIFQKLFVLYNFDFMKLILQTIVVSVLIWIFYKNIIKQFISNLLKK